MSEQENERKAAAYESLFRSEYDTRYTADISNKMQMPDRLGGVSNRLDSFPFDSPAHGYGTSGGAQHMMMDPSSYFMVGTPPRVLTGQHAMYSDDEDDDDDNLLYRHYSELHNGLIDRFAPHVRRDSQSTPAKLMRTSEKVDFDAAAVPMTPGTMLVAQSGDEMALIRRQLGKLISHVRRLEDENSRRQQREMFLYPVVIGFCLYHLAKLVVKYK